MEASHDRGVDFADHHPASSSRRPWRWLGKRGVTFTGENNGMALVTRITGDCPGCGGHQTYGNVSVDKDAVRMGCRRCKIRVNRPLPAIKKKIVYLDQCVLSGAFRGKDPRYIQVVERVKRVCSYQLVIAPYSNVHEDETHQWRGHDGQTYEQLMAFIKSTARGTEFEPAYEVERAQVGRGFSAYLGRSSPADVLQEGDAVRGDTSGWEDYFYIDVGRYMGDVDLKRQLKSQAVATLVGVFDGWVKSNNTFAQDFALEVKASGDAFVNAYVDMVKRVAGGDYAAIYDSPIASQVVETLQHYMPDGTPPDVVMKTILTYFSSPSFADVPSIMLSCAMFAGLKDQVKRGAFANREVAAQRLSGVFDDVKHISTYAPYCDAFFMDNAMADLVCSPLVQLDKKFKTKVFCLNTRTDFLAWLDEVEAAMTPEHVAALETAYGITAR